MRRKLTVAALTIAVAACGSGEGEAQQGAGARATAVATAPSASATESAPPAAATARKVAVENELYSFAYAWPAAASAIPQLAAALEADLARQQGELAAQAAEDRKAREGEDFPYHQHMRTIEWQVVTQIPGWLSLSSHGAGYSGGAHGMTWFGSLLWDKAANQEREVTDLFKSAAALSAAIRTPFCAALDRERARRRGAPVNRASGDTFDECIDPVKSTLILGSSNRRQFDRIGVLVGPYEAGPYAEGEYEVTLPVTAAVLAGVRPEYRAAFGTGR